MKLILDFEKLWALKPEEKSKVYVYDKDEKTHKEKVIYRSYRSYLKIPPFDPNLPKSYMYDGLEPSIPNELIPILKAAWGRDARFNQMVVNWYEPDDYIEPHRDCDHHFVEDYYIGIVTINEFPSKPRRLEFTPVGKGLTDSITLHNGWFMMSASRNRNFRHKIGSGEGRRISVTFRMLKE